MTITREQMDRWDAEVNLWKERAERAESQTKMLKKDARFIAEICRSRVQTREYRGLSAAIDRILEATKEKP